MQTATDASPPARPNSTLAALTKTRAFVIVLIAIPIAAIVLSVLFVRYTPAKITSYDHLESWLERRVEFIGVFDGDQKGYELIVFQGHPIVFQHTRGAIEWSPDTGERCRVVGRLKRNGRPLYGLDGRVDYTLTDAEYYPELQ